jgi:hypothetical protein
MSDDAIKQVLGLLYQEDTLRVLAALVLNGAPEESGLDKDATRRALDRLERGGLVVREDDGRWRARRERFRELLHATAKPAPSTSPEEKVLQSFLVEGRLRAIPSKRDKQLIVLNYVAQVFEPGVRYSALRRYLVDDRLLSRENNVYWRSGGSVEA